MTALLADLRLALTTTSASTASADTSAWYVLVNRNSGKALDVTNRDPRSGGDYSRLSCRRGLLTRANSTC